MATKRILKLTNTEAIVKIDGEPGTVTIDLDVDLKLSSEDIVGTPRVNIITMQVSGKPNSVLSVARNSENLWDLQANTAELVDLNNIGGISDPTNNTSDIVVTSSTAEGQLLLRLRKVSGYVTKDPVLFRYNAEDYFKEIYLAASSV